MPQVIMPPDHPADALNVNGQIARPGVPVEVDDLTAVSLVEQGWSLAGDLPSKADLLALAEAQGVEVKASWSRQKIADALAAQPASDDADPQES